MHSVVLSSEDETKLGFFNFVLIFLFFFFLPERNRPLAGCTSWLYMFHLFSAVCGETCAHLVFIIHYKTATPPLAVRLFKWDITEAHFLARYRRPYSLSNHNDWQCGVGPWKQLVPNKHTNKSRTGPLHRHKLIYTFIIKKWKYMGHTFASFFHSPVQPCGNKANTLFSPYVLLKRALFDLKLIGQAWAQGLKA